MENEAVLINKFESIERCIKRMIGFRNMAIHNYKQIDEKILQDVIENHLVDLINFARTILNLRR